MRAGRHKTRLAATAVQSAVEARVTHSLMDRRAARSTRGGNGSRQAARMKKDSLANHHSVALAWLLLLRHRGSQPRGRHAVATARKEAAGDARAAPVTLLASGRSCCCLLRLRGLRASSSARGGNGSQGNGGRRERLWLCWLLLACGGGSPGCCCGGEMDGQNRMAMALDFGTEI